MGGSKGKGSVSLSKHVRAPWVKQEAPRRESAVVPVRKGSFKCGSKGDAKGKKGKGKGKKKGAAAFNSKFWERKLENENRSDMQGTYTGTIAKYIFKQGWGFILPDDPDSLPPEAKKALANSNAEAKAKADEKGKELQTENCIYFRKPDVDPELYPLHEGTPVSFEVYMDDKGLGACNIASGDEMAEDEEAS